MHDELACLPETQVLRPGLGRGCAFLGPRNALPPPRLLKDGGWGTGILEGLLLLHSVYG